MLFIGRRKELQKFETCYNSTRAELIILYGRRRIGKTAFLRKFMEGKEAFYFNARESEDNEQREKFKQKMLSFGFDNEPSSLDDWKGIFQNLIGLKLAGRKLIIIDGSQTLFKGNREFPSIVQKAWGNLLSKENIMIVFCVSTMDNINASNLTEKNPLYGYATLTLKMNELPFDDVMKFFPDYTLDEKIVAYSILGGVPLYLRQFSSSLSLEENIERNILSNEALLYNETEFILKQELRETATYNTLLSAIAHGNTRLSDISQKTNINPTKANVYLKNLIELSIVVKEYSILEPAESTTNIHNGRYRITDNFFHFWYRFVYPNTDIIEMGNTGHLANQISECMEEGYTLTCFKELCIMYIRERNSMNDLPFMADRIGKIWGKTFEIDVGAINGKALLIGECLWSDSPAGIEIANNMKEKIMNNKQLSDREDYILCVFSNSGFTPTLIEESNRSGINLCDTESMFGI